METFPPEQRLKELVKEAVSEALKERADLLHALVVEALEDFLLARAVEEGLQTEPVSEERIRPLLRPAR